MVDVMTFVTDGFLRIGMRLAAEEGAAGIQLRHLLPFCEGLLDPLHRFC